MQLDIPKRELQSSVPKLVVQGEFDRLDQRFDIRKRYSSEAEKEIDSRVSMFPKTPKKGSNQNRAGASAPAFFQGGYHAVR